MRWTWGRALVAGALLASLLGLAAGETTAQDLTTYGPPDAWTSRCEVDRMTDEKSCRLIIYKQYEQGRGFEYIALTLLPIGGEYHLFLTGSEGLVDSCAIRVGTQPKIDGTGSTVNMCVFPNTPGVGWVDRFKNGASVLIRAEFVDVGRRDVDFTLTGFTRSFEEMERILSR